MNGTSGVSVSVAERCQYTPFFKFKSTDVNLLSCLVCLSDKMEDLALCLFGSPVNQTPSEGSIQVKIIPNELKGANSFILILHSPDPSNQSKHLATTRTPVLHNSQLLQKFKCQEKFIYVAILWYQATKCTFPKLVNLKRWFALLPFLMCWASTLMASRPKQKFQCSLTPGREAAFPVCH